MYRGCVRMRTVLAGALPCLIALCCVWPFVLKAALDDGLDAQPSLVVTQKDTRDRDYVFVSAFFDDRLDTARPSIRVLGYHRRARARPLYCEVRLRTGESLCLAPAATVVPLDPSTMFNETVVEHFYVCRLAYWHRPVAVSLGFSPNCRGDNDERIALDVRYSSAAVGRVRSPSGFGVCLSDVISRRVLRSHSDVQTLVECIEMNVILGMDRMYIYVGDMNPEVMLTLRKYMRRRLVEIVDWSSEQAALTDRGVALSLNDCLYRHMDRHRYLVFSGVDQLVLPHRQMSWRALLADVAAAHNSNSVGAYVFAAFRYYDETTDDRKSSRRSLRGSTTSYRLPRIVTHRVRDKVAGNATRDARFIVEPRRLISIATTRISRMLPGYLFTSVSPLLGSAHQFESSTKLNAKDLQTRVVVDSSHDKYVPRLLKVLHQRFYRK
ncbi:hypothetical protein NP493_811g00000 [Ridgeia piscesae]|uniref:Glycosyltransferase family 92 protein n=1 Tax=Ridgeia piscesae TaxID=27915 RepID=A0AAD9KNC2_RIDPI|nr:hypothetical protein NP493_811g00000 [Ridgeia piscesae]